MVKVMIDVAAMSALDLARYKFYIQKAQIADCEIEAETYLDQVRQLEKKYPLSKDLSAYFKEF